MTFEEKVLEFVNDPARSDRNGLYAVLAKRNFFSANSEDQKQIILNLLDSDTAGICDAGKEKFRKHMGNLLEGRTRTVTLELTFEELPGNTNAFEVYSDSSVASDVKKHLSACAGKAGKNNLYRSVKVKVI